MKNNFQDKNYIKFDDMHDLLRLFSWFKFIMFFFNIKLIQNELFSLSEISAETLFLVPNNQENSTLQSVRWKIQTHKFNLIESISFFSLSLQRMYMISKQNPNKGPERDQMNIYIEIRGGKQVSEEKYLK